MQSQNFFEQVESAGTLSELFTNTSTIWPYSYNYPLYWNCNHQESKTEKSYQIVRALIKAKIIEIKTLSKFFEVMDEIIKVI